MKRIILMMLFSCIIYESTIAQDTTYNRNFSYGVNLIGISSNSIHAGINFSSPYFWEKTFAVKLSSNAYLFKYIPLNEDITFANAEYKKSNFYDIRLGIIGKLREKIVNPYVEIGAVGIIPHKNFTEEKFSVGIYGTLGIEFMYSKRGSFIIEGTALNVETKADKVFGKPKFATDFQISLGLRAYIGKK